MAVVAGGDVPHVRCKAGAMQVMRGRGDLETGAKECDPGGDPGPHHARSVRSEKHAIICCMKGGDCILSRS